MTTRREKTKQMLTRNQTTNRRQPPFPKWQTMTRSKKRQLHVRHLRRCRRRCPSRPRKRRQPFAGMPSSRPQGSVPKRRHPASTSPCRRITRTHRYRPFPPSRRVDRLLLHRHRIGIIITTATIITHRRTDIPCRRCRIQQPIPRGRIRRRHTIISSSPTPKRQS